MTDFPDTDVWQDVTHLLVEGTLCLDPGRLQQVIDALDEPLIYDQLVAALGDPFADQVAVPSSTPLKTFPTKYRAWRKEGGYRTHPTFEEALAEPDVARVDRHDQSILWFHDMQAWADEG